MLAWHCANLMNRLRWSKSTPTVTVSTLLGSGRDVRSFGSKEALDRYTEGADNRAGEDR